MYYIVMCRTLHRRTRDIWTMQAASDSIEHDHMSFWPSIVIQEKIIDNTRIHPPAHALTANFRNGKWMSFFRCFTVLSERSCCRNGERINIVLRAAAQL